MNTASVIITAVIAVLFALAVRHIIKNRGSCAACGQENCPLHAGGKCPSCVRCNAKADRRMQ